MHEHLNFPSANYVGKSMTSEEFLKFANIHKKENKYLKNHLGSIEILYSFQYDDGEVIVLSVEYFSNNDSKFSLNNFVKTIAQSIPYKIILIVNIQGFTRFFCFEEAPNKRNERRTAISKIHASRSVQIVNRSNNDEDILNQLIKVTCEASSANELIQGWCSILPKYKFSSKRKVYYRIPEWRKKYETMIDDDYDENMNDDEEEDEEQENEDYISHRIYGQYGCDGFYKSNKIEIDYLVAFFAYHFRAMLDEYSWYFNGAITIDEWTEIYLAICNKLYPLSYNCESEIINSFWDGNDAYEYAEDYCDVEYFKNFIGEYLGENYYGIFDQDID